jgi:aspartyl-tRNA(Asn)/glutamyl-tRNA(Gln) amidotransferase subunit A
MSFAPKTRIADLLANLSAGKVSAAELLETALERIKDPAGEGGLAFVGTMEESARAEAEASDKLRASGRAPRPLEGLPSSVKDLFDVAGQVTRAGAMVTKDDAPAAEDAPIVQRLRAAGAVIVGRTNMTEFAYSGIGLNPHFGTPANAWDRETRRIPGGSSSGAAVSVTDGMAVVGIGSDTGGSVRIPSGLNGLTGLKPTQSRVPIEGAFPLSPSLDSVGPLAPSVACARLVDQVMAGENPSAISKRSVEGMRFLVAESVVLDGLDEETAQAFDRALSKLSKAGARIERLPVTELLRIPEVNAKGGFVAPECYGLHRAYVDGNPDAFDPRVIARIKRHSEQNAADYFDLLRARTEIQREVSAVTRNYDAVLMPTTPRIAPPIADLEADDALFGSQNLLMLRNCSVGNFLDRCALSLPMHEAGEAPVGLMLMGERMADETLCEVALAVEGLFS